MAKRTPQPIVPPSNPATGMPYLDEYGDMDGIEIMDASPKEFQLPGVSPHTEFQLPEPHNDAMSNFLAPKPITNADIVTSADKNINSFWQTDAGQAQKAQGGTNIAAPVGSNPWQPNKMQSTTADKPENYLSPEARKMTGYGNAALGGIAAGSQVQQTPDSGDAMLGVLGAGLGGAAAGFAAGGPVGAAIGGAAGIVTGGINAYVGTKSARKAQRAQDKIRRDIQAREEARYQQARKDAQKYFDIERGDSLEKERYNRRLTAQQSHWAAQQKAQDALNNVIAQDEKFKHMLVGDLR